MAFINCPECGGKVSDSALMCPHCGYNVSKGENTSQKTESSNKSKISVIALNCSRCGAPISSSDIVSGGWARCKSCGKEMRISDEIADLGPVEVIIPFTISKDRFHCMYMDMLMKEAEEDVFSEMKNLELKEFFVWVRQFGHGDTQQFYPMDSWGKMMFLRATMGCEIMEKEQFEKYFPNSQIVKFNYDVIRDREVVPREMSPKDSAHEYMTNVKSKGGNPTDYYYCIPFIRETFEYKGKKYSYWGTGNGSWFSCDPFPKNAMLLDSKGPKYTDKRPVRNVVRAILIAIFAICLIAGVVECFIKEGIVEGIVTTVVIGVLGAILLTPIAFVATLIDGIITFITSIFDKPIQKIINSKRRKKYRNEYQRIQQRKQEEARNALGLNLSYTVPEFPIP